MQVTSFFTFYVPLVNFGVRRQLRFLSLFQIPKRVKSAFVAMHIAMPHSVGMIAAAKVQDRLPDSFFIVRSVVAQGQ